MFNNDLFLLLTCKWSHHPKWLCPWWVLLCFSGCIIIPLLEPLPKFGSRWQPKEASKAWTIIPNWTMSSAAKMSYSTSQQPQLQPPSAPPASVVQSSTENLSSNTNQVEVENRLFPRCTSTTNINDVLKKTTNSSSTTVKKKTKKKKSATSTTGTGAGTKTTKKVLKNERVCHLNEWDAILFAVKQSCGMFIKAKLFMKA